jgi:3'-phosphoadenosine 5'-phosphosulfate sulfotransferase (PAPS reductase)/FAD synthetase
MESSNKQKTLPIGKKQSATHEDFVSAWDRIADIVSREQYEGFKAVAVSRVKRLAAGKRCAYGWSGGKDSIALGAVCEAAGVHRCVFGMTNHLEYPAWLRWVTDNMPEGLTVIKNGWDLNWLAENQNMLFPSNANIAAKWFKGVQHHAQETYFNTRKLEMIFLGRRKSDGNYTGGKGETVYESKGVVRASPIANWSHEIVLASMYYEGFADNLPPFYHWPRGYRCGTHSWAARQWCDSVEHGWSEIYGIDPSIVRAASEKIGSAKLFLEGVE